MPVLAIVALGIAVAGAVARPLRLASWVAPVVAAAVELAAGALRPGQALGALGPLAPALGFLLAAVPLAVMLDSLGFFESLARLLSKGAHLVGWLWVLAAVTTTVLNLDASVVLLTPLYVRVAKRSGIAPLSLAFQPVLLAVLASSALPVSNLTNLIATSKTGASPVAFLVHMGPPSLVAAAVGFVLYRRTLKPGVPKLADAEPPDMGSLRLGGALVGVLLVGFVLGPSYGVQPWMVAAGADLALVGLALVGLGGSRGPLRRALSAIPWGTAVLAAALGLLAYAVGSSLPIAQYLRGSGPGALARTIGLAALAANLANNLPTLLVALPALAAHANPELWALLLGVNMGPVVLATGALATLLWLECLHRLGVEAKPADFTRVGIKVGVPALLAATGVLIGLSALLGP